MLRRRRATDTNRMKIFNLSLPKTGTTSFGAMMRAAGHTVCDGNWSDHKTNFLMLAAHKQDYDLIDRVARGFDAFSDAPFGGTQYYRQAARTFPDARFLLVKRDPEAWWTSFAGMVDANSGIDNAAQPIEEKLNIAFDSGRYGYPLIAMDLCCGDATKAGFLRAKAAYETQVEAFFGDSDRFHSGTIEAFAAGGFNRFLGLSDTTRVPQLNPAKGSAADS